MVFATCRSLVSGEHPFSWNSKEIVRVRKRYLSMRGEADGSCLYWLWSKATLTVIHVGGNKICPKLNTPDFCLKISGRYVFQMCTRSPIDPDIRAEGLSVEQGLKLVAWSLVTAHSHLSQCQCSSLFVFYLWSHHKGIRKAMLLPTNVCLLFRRL